MPISLPLRSDFLRSTFPRTRYTLEGNWIKVRVSYQEVELFSGDVAHSAPAPALLAPAMLTPATPAPATPPAPTTPAPVTPSPPTRTGFARAFSIALNLVLSFVIISSIFLALILFTPDVYYGIFPSNAGTIATTIPMDVGASPAEQQVVSPSEAPAYLPPKDESLPEGAWLVIPRIGVRTELQRTPTAEEALKTGVWQVPEFGEPGDTTQPIILAAHRYGWKWWWQSEYWRYHSFYLLPETESGDRVEILYDQRRWVYEIYAGEEGNEIEDYSASLILYTCKFLNSDVRHILYARLLNPENSTQ
jgi:hypothetical protein